MGNKKRLLLAVFLILAVIAAAGSGVLIALKQSGMDLLPALTDGESGSRTGQYVPEMQTPVEDTTDWSSITYQGEQWNRNRRLKTVLFLGIDKKAQVQSHSLIGTGGRADTVLLFVMDPDSRTTKILQISRDTILPVDVYNEDRELLYTGEMQINMQYAFGESAARSCFLMKKKISELLYGVPVDSCCAVTIDGMVSIVDALGGVPLTLEEDWTDIDPAYTAGASVTMDGRAVERFVRYRDTAEVGSNDVRMERQAWFFTKLLSILKKRGSAELIDLLDQAGDGVYTDMDAETMKDFTKYSLGSDPVKLPGETRRGELHDEYSLNEGALRELILNTFYTKAE